MAWRWWSREQARGGGAMTAWRLGLMVNRLLLAAALLATGLGAQRPLAGAEGNPPGWRTLLASAFAAGSPGPCCPRRPPPQTPRAGPAARQRYPEHREGSGEEIAGNLTPAADQNVSFRANCNSLGFGLNAVAVTTPKVRD